MPGSDGQRDPKDRFKRSLRGEKARGLAHPPSAKQRRQNTENNGCGDPKSEGNSEVAEKIRRAFPAFSGNISKGFSTPAQTPINVPEHNPFPGHRGQIKQQPIRVMNSARAMDREVSGNSHSGHDQDKKESVERSGYGLEPPDRRLRTGLRRKLAHKSPHAHERRADSLTFQKIPSPAFVECGSPAAAFAMAPDRWLICNERK